MADSRRIKGWKNLTVKGHVSAPIIPPSILAQQRKRRAYHTPTRNGPSRRRKVEAVRLIPAQALIDNYNRRKEATARFQRVSGQSALTARLDCPIHSAGSCATAPHFQNTTPE